MASIVLKSYVSTRIDGEGRQVVWQKVSSHRSKVDGSLYARVDYDMTREEAKEYIKKHKLVKTFENADGAVYDTPEETFRQFGKDIKIKLDN